MNNPQGSHRMTRNDFVNDSVNEIVGMLTLAYACNPADPNLGMKQRQHIAKIEALFGGIYDRFQTALREARGDTNGQPKPIPAQTRR